MLIVPYERIDDEKELEGASAFLKQRVTRFWRAHGLSSHARAPTCATGMMGTGVGGGGAATGGGLQAGTAHEYGDHEAIEFSAC